MSQFEITHPVTPSRRAALWCMLSAKHGSLPTPCLSEPFENRGNSLVFKGASRGVYVAQRSAWRKATSRRHRTCRDGGEDRYRRDRGRVASFHRCRRARTAWWESACPQNESRAPTRDRQGSCKGQIRQALKPKPEFPPLLPSGLRVLSEAELYSLTVEGFKSSQRRQPLWDSLMQFCDELRDEGLIPCRLWLDGSFLTKKIDPDDIDILVQASHTIVDRIPTTPDAITTRIDNRAWYAEPRKLDTFLLTTWPAFHAMFVVGYEGWKYWEDAFGHALISREEKGIAVLEVGP